MHAVQDSWSSWVRRAEQLSADGGPASPLLAFYARVLRQQHDACTSFTGHRPSASVEEDFRLIAAIGIPLLNDVATSGPTDLARQARAFLKEAAALEDSLREYWQERSDRHFFAKALFQPYMVARAESEPAHAVRADNRCPRCGGSPQASVLDGSSASVEGGGRRLICATCLTAWPFRRVVCPSCGEEDEKHLGYFQSATLSHVRIDACDTCGRYLKTIDIGRGGLAVPLVDEVAAAALDVWAGDHGFQKIELNLAGL
jgi:formate dehydrogenase maturation protein FdhE